MKYKATEKFKELGIENSYHHLFVYQYYALREGKETECNLSSKNKYLTKDGYIEIVKETKQKVRGI